MTERVAERYRDLDLWPPEEVLEALYEGQLRALAALKGALPALKGAALAAADRLRSGGTLVYAGAGTSGRLAAIDGAELWPTFGFGRVRLLLAGGEKALWEAVEGAEDDLEGGLRLGRGLAPEDVLVAVAASGTTPFTLGVLRGAKGRGALTVALANNPGTPLLEEADHPVLLDTGPEVVAGSTRLGAGTAQKAALNLFSTTVMVLLGRVYGNRMARMRAQNAKLLARAALLAEEALGVPRDAAERLLLEYPEPALAALVYRGLGPEEALALLEAKGVRGALAEVGR
ncbi:N-acetylmuramic acid 6-phosphate etherase [Thermus thalpophilus]|uniref:N-acetylmuramic acid 6-phosphate etherase n=1 Tax=Thermus thalpophilus TaxID=2908147 RepID=UPI001FA970F2|nr:N-acetylmuramic acid 6-phosphate etherase [Thermus thalpophilus]